MTFVPVLNTVQTNLKFVGPNGQTVENILYWVRDTAWTVGDLADLAIAIATRWNAGPRAQTIASYALNSVYARDLTTENSAVYENFIVPPAAGTRAGNNMPANVTWAIKFSTGIAGRSFRGRNYLVGLAEAEITGDYISSTYGAAYLAAWSAMIAAVETDADVIHCVVSRYSNGVPRVAGLATPVISYGSADLRVDTQRRRLAESGA